MSNKDVVTSEYSLLFGDCLERMKEIPDGSVDLVLTDENVIKLYQQGMSMRQVAEKLGTNHKLVGRILKRNGVNKRVHSSEKLFSSPLERLYANMQTHLRFDVPLEWIMSFSNIDKLKCLNNLITNRDSRWSCDSSWYIEYIEKFYYDKQFNMVYTKWVESDGCRYMKPSLDHIVPKSKGGGNDLDNLQVLSWFENRCKNNMTQQDWNLIKENIEEYLI